MKKTEKTAMTAALFAVAMNMVPSGAVDAAAVGNSSTTFTTAVGGANSAASAITALYDPVKEVNEEMAGVYGPAPDYYEVPTEAPYEPDTEMPEPVYGPAPDYEIPTEAAYEPTTAMPQPVYGPAPCYNGDMNHDGVTDVFDMVLLRQMYVKYMNDAYNSEASWFDVNGDGKLTIADLVSVQKYLLGQTSYVGGPDKAPVTQPAVTTTAAIPTEFDPAQETQQLVYGPPWVFGITTAPETKKNTTTTTTAIDEPSQFDPGRETMIAVYGPPGAFD